MLLLAFAASAVGLADAGSTVTAAFPDLGICLVVRMTLGAMRFKRVSCGRSTASQDVLAVRHHVHMAGVQARENSTQMIEFSPFGDWPDQQLVSHSVYAI